MNNGTARHSDNRDAAQMYEYLEARIDVLKRRISELEVENQTLHRNKVRDTQESKASDYVHEKAAAWR
jgi:hypothetical protein